MSDISESWRVHKMPGLRISHPYIAVTPGCPSERHPTRWCKCKVHRTQAQALDYINEQEDMIATAKGGERD